MKSGKILFLCSPIITASLEQGRDTAPGLLTLAHHRILKNIYGEENTILYHEDSGHLKFLPFLLGGWGLPIPSVQRLVKVIRDEGVREIFLPNTLYGHISKFIKKKFSGIKVFTFAHNVETDLIHRSQQHLSPALRSRMGMGLSFFLSRRLYEKWAVLYCDLLFPLTQRDRDLFLSYFPQVDPGKIRILPATLPVDLPHPSSGGSLEPPLLQTTELHLLFVASDWYPNVEGIHFFIEQVLPHLPPATLHLAGGICDKKSEFPTPHTPDHRVVFHGYLPDLGELYRQAHFVVIPVFWGGGMKIKVAQALQHGKTLFATSEALTGYRVDPGIGEVCDDRHAFITKIGSWIRDKKTQKWNSASRRLYEREYRLPAVEGKLREILNPTGIHRG